MTPAAASGPWGAEGTGVTPSLGVGSKGRLWEGRRSTSRTVSRVRRGDGLRRGGGSAGEAGGTTRDGPREGESRPRRSRSIARMRWARPARSDTRSGTGRPGSPKGRRGTPSTDAPIDAGEGRCSRPRDATRSCRSRLRGRAPLGQHRGQGVHQGQPDVPRSQLPLRRGSQIAVHRLDARRASEFQSWNAHHVRVKQASARIPHEGGRVGGRPVWWGP